MTPCKRYTEAFISRVADNAVPEQERSGFFHHAQTCGTCAETLENYRQMGQMFTSHTANQVHQIHRELPPICVTSPQGRLRCISAGLKLKLASLSAAALILAVSLYTWQSDTGPSAIVNSVDTYGSSVMIIETSESQHTIIWFSET
jgi:hypothetical protein